MRFRNTPTAGATFSGNKKSSLLGRTVRSRLFVPMDNARMFEQAPLGNKYPTLRTVGADGGVVDTPVQPRNPEPAEWEMEPKDPTLPMTDTLPPENFAEDVRPGGVDRPSSSTTRGPIRYAVTGTTTTHSLNVSAPTAANCAQVLSALLKDLQPPGITRRV